MRLKNFYFIKVILNSSFFFKTKNLNKAKYSISYQFLAPKVVPVLRRNKAPTSVLIANHFSAVMKTLVLGNLFKFLRFAIMHIHEQFSIVDNEKNRTIVIFSSFLTPSGKLPVKMWWANLKSLNKLPSTGVFISAEKWMVRSTEVGGYLGVNFHKCVNVAF